MTREGEAMVNMAIRVGGETPGAFLMGIMVGLRMAYAHAGAAAVMFEELPEAVARAEGGPSEVFERNLQIIADGIARSAR